MCLGAAAADQAPQTRTEAANVRLVVDFCAAWSGPALDLEQLFAQYFNDDCIVRVMDSQMLTTGRVATIAMFRGWLEGGRHFELKILRNLALGPLVINLRTDTAFAPGKPAAAATIASAFVIRGGKIQEWSDYRVPEGA
jgi:limonene-1,2-epoxide hydrolase